MPISFGSVGDIIAVCLIVKDLVRALDDARGSSADYRAVRIELRALERALLEVEILSRSQGSTVKLNALYATARKAALDCRHPVEAFLEKIKKYERSLGDGASRNIVRDTAMKIRWQISQKDDISRFRAEINAHSSSINMLLATVNVNLAQTNHEALSEQLIGSNDKQVVLLEEVRDRLAENNALVSAGNALTIKIKDTSRLDWFRQLGAELKDFMRRIINVNIATYNMVVSIQSSISGGLQRSLTHEPSILEDAIGRISPIHVQFINSWEAFEAVLDLRFRHIQGHKKILREEYVLQEHATRREISRNRSWEGAFLPGQRIDMSLIFNSEGKKTVKTTCPSCQTEAQNLDESETQCQTCGLSYRRVTEIFEVDPPTLVRPPGSNLHRTAVKFGIPSFTNVEFGPKRPSQFQLLPGAPKRKLDHTQLEEDDISQFKRVCVVSKENRIKYVAGPFAHQSSGSQALIDPSIRQQEEENTAWEEFRALQSSMGHLHADTISSFYSLFRRLRNRGKYRVAEELIRDVLKIGEDELLTHRSELLQLMLSGLMAVLVDQGKLEDADGLWQSSMEIFRLRLGEHSASALESMFQQSHPLRPLPSVTLEKAIFLNHIDMVQSTETGKDRQSSLSADNRSETIGITLTGTDSQLQNTGLGLFGLVGPFKISQMSTRALKIKGKDEQSQLDGEEANSSWGENDGYFKPRNDRIITAVGPLYNNKVIRLGWSRGSGTGFELAHTIMKNEYRRVRLVRSLHDGKYYALKILKKKAMFEQDRVSSCMAERDYHLWLSDPSDTYILEFRGSGQDSKNLYMMTEFAEGGTLLSLMFRSGGRLQNDVAKFYAAEIVNALSYIHLKNLCYRNLSLGTIYLNRLGHIKLCGFGYVKAFEDEAHTLCGVPEYVAPEMLGGSKYNHSVDWWALGIGIFQMLSGVTPFGPSHREYQPQHPSKDQPQLTYQRISKGKFDYPPHINQEAQDVISGLLMPDPSLRLGISGKGPMEILDHTWFRGVQWRSILHRGHGAPWVPDTKPDCGDTSMYDELSEEDDSPGHSSDEGEEE